MIFVMFGTNPYSFNRLARAIDDFAGSSDEDVVVQAGYTVYPFHHIKGRDFYDRTVLEKYQAEASMVIVQGGFGSIAECLRMKKRIIAVPRKRELGECQDGGDGQEELVRALESEGRLIGLYDVARLAQVAQDARVRAFNYDVSTDIPQRVAEYVNGILGND